MRNFVFFNNEFIPYDKARIPLATHAFHYGTGCFEGIRAYWNKKEKALFIFRMEDHYKRLLNSCKILMIKLPYSVDTLCQITLELLRKNKYQRGVYIRPIAYKAETTILDFNLQKLKDNFAIYPVPLGHYLNVLRGISVCTSSWRRIDDNSLPARAKLTGAYINTSLAKTEAILNGYEEAILLDQEGHISEGSAENIFLVKNKQVITPAVFENILEGITRDTVISLLGKELKIKTIERVVDRTELYLSDEIFLVGTGAEITPIIEIDRRKVGNGKPGKLTKKVQKLYFKVVQKEMRKYISWCTKV